MTKSREKSKTQPILPDDVKKKLNKIINTLLGDYYSSDFIDPVDLEGNHILTLAFPFYTDFVDKPMCLSLVKKNLKKDIYTTDKAFFSDIDLIWQNCVKFNKDDSLIVQTANILAKTSKALENKYYGKVESVDEQKITPEVKPVNIRKRKKGLRKVLKKVKLSKPKKKVSEEVQPDTDNLPEEVKENEPMMVEEMILPKIEPIDPIEVERYNEEDDNM
jgi:hypothetical protein